MLDFFVVCLFVLVSLGFDLVCFCFVWVLSFRDRSIWQIVYGGHEWVKCLMKGMITLKKLHQHLSSLSENSAHIYSSSPHVFIYCLPHPSVPRLNDLLWFYPKACTFFKRFLLVLYAPWTFLSAVLWLLRQKINSVHRSLQSLGQKHMLTLGIKRGFTPASCPWTRWRQCSVSSQSQFSWSLVMLGCQRAVAMRCWDEAMEGWT